HIPERKKIKSLTKSLENLHAEVAHLLADLNRATILEAERDKEILHLKATPPEFASFFWGHFRLWSGSSLLLMNLTEFRLNSFLLRLGRLTESSFLIAQTNYAFLNKDSEHAVTPLYVILQLEPEKLARLANVPALKDTYVSLPLVKESTMTPVFESLKVPSNVIPASSTAALEPNKEWVNAMVDGPDHEMTDGVVNVKPGSMFMHLMLLMMLLSWS
nr:hypothetical protein [Tanacetum cinerariifolium]